MIGRNFTVKMRQNFLNTMQKISLQNPLPKNTKKISFMTSLTMFTTN